MHDQKIWSGKEVFIYLGYILLYLIISQIENTVAFQNKSKVHLINYIYL